MEMDIGVLERDREKLKFRGSRGTDEGPERVVGRQEKILKIRTREG